MDDDPVIFELETKHNALRNSLKSELSAAAVFRTMNYK